MDSASGTATPSPVELMGATTTSATENWQLGIKDAKSTTNEHGQLVDSVFGKLPDVTTGTIGIVAAVCATIIGTLLIVLICVCHRRRRLLVTKATNNKPVSSHQRRRQSGLSSLVTGLPGSSSGSPWGDGEDDEANGDGAVADTTFATTVSSGGSDAGRGGATFSPRLVELGALLPAGAASRQLSKSSFGQPRTATIGSNGKAAVAAAAAAAVATTSTSSTFVGLRQKQQQNLQSRQNSEAFAIPEAENGSSNQDVASSTRSKYTYEVVV